MYEAQFLAEDGATPAQVDKALTDWGMAMGIFAVDDMGGLDVAWRVRQELNQFSDPAQRKPLVADQLVAMNHLGQKTGSGWYIYDDEPQGHARPGGRGADRAHRDGRRHRPPQLHQRGDHRAHDLRARERGREDPRGGLRAARRRHRRHLSHRLRLPQLPRRADVLRRLASACSRSTSAWPRSTASTAHAGRRRRCSSGSRARARPSAPSTRAAPRRRPAPDMSTGTSSESPAARRVRPVTSPTTRRTCAARRTAPSTCGRRRPLEPYPVRLTDRLEHWAAEAPDRVFLAQRPAPAPGQAAGLGDGLAHGDLRRGARSRCGGWRRGCSIGSCRATAPW